MSNRLTTALLALVVLGSLIGFAAIGTAQTSEFSTNSTHTLTNSSEPITVSVDWNGSAATNDSATVTFENETAANNSGNVTGDLASDTLNGTTLNMSTVHPAATYTVDLDTSTVGTVTVDSSAFADDGTVDLSAETSDSVATDDTVLSVDMTANTLLEDTISADAGNTTTAEYNQSDAGLELGNEYRVTVTGNSTAIDSASISDDSGFLGGVVSGSGLEGNGLLIGGAVIGVAVIGAVVWTMRD